MLGRTSSAGWAQPASGFGEAKDSRPRESLPEWQGERPVRIQRGAVLAYCGKAPTRYTQAARPVGLALRRRRGRRWAVRGRQQERPVGRAPRGLRGPGRAVRGWQGARPVGRALRNRQRRRRAVHGRQAERPAGRAPRRRQRRRRAVRGRQAARPLGRELPRRRGPRRAVRGRRAARPVGLSLREGTHGFPHAWSPCEHAMFLARDHGWPRSFLCRERVVPRLSGHVQRLEERCRAPWKGTGKPRRATSIFSEFAASVSTRSCV